MSDPVSETTRRPKDRYVVVGPSGVRHGTVRQSEKSAWITVCRGGSDDDYLAEQIEAAKDAGYRVEKLNV